VAAARHRAYAKDHAWPKAWDEKKTAEMATLYPDALVGLRTVPRGTVLDRVTDEAGTLF